MVAGLVEKHPMMLYLKRQKIFPPHAPLPVHSRQGSFKPNETG